MRAVPIAGSFVGEDYPCFVIAEAGVNHNRDLKVALRMVDVAVDAGANAVKFQTFSADTLASPSAPQFPYALEANELGLSQRDMLRRVELPREMHHPIQKRCEERGILFLSTPFHETDADWLETFGVPAFKIPSGEITNLPFLRHVAAKRRPVLLSTGMATLAEVDRAVEAILVAGNEQLVLLHCVSDYPADPADANLRAIETMRRAFTVPVGFSDHTQGVEVAIAAVALGAAVIEKHFTLDRNLPGPDHRASLQPDELRALVSGIRIVEASLGSGIKRPAASEMKTLLCVRKSLVAACDLAAGQQLSAEMLAVRRPGNGLAPDMQRFLVGRRLVRAVQEGGLITLDDVS